ncbi:hypothetical protein [Planctomicrobium piriforme]|nr:hypothetical protein [Planctomicrobium piriforme]
MMRPQCIDISPALASGFIGAWYDPRQANTLFRIDQSVEKAMWI